MLITRKICKNVRRILYSKRGYPGEYKVTDDYLWKQLNFLATEFINCESLMSLERYEEQKEEIYRSILASSCTLATEVFRPIKVS